MATSSFVPTNTGAPASDFWGGFFGSLAGTISRTADAVLPVWTAQQLGLQQNDQLANKGVTYVALQPRADDLPLASLGGNTGTLLLIGGAVLLAVIALR